MKKLGIRIGIIVLFFSVWGSFDMKVYAAEETPIEVKEVYHIHTGDSVNGGGCYSVQQTRTEYRDCVDYARHRWDGDENVTCCPNCGASSYKAKYHWEKFCPTTNQPYGTLRTEEHYTCCAYETSSGSADYSYTHQVPYQVIYYELGCEKDETILMGTIGLTKSVGAGQYFLKVFCTDLVSIDSCLWNTGETMDTLEITSNGIYSCTVNYSESERSDSVTFTYEVVDYDVTPPEVTVLYDDGTWSQSKTITVEAIDAGVGLHTEAYRFQGGEWTDVNSFTVTGNGTYSIEVRDALENVSLHNVIITHIDSQVPEVTVLYDDNTWEKSKTITLAASDSESGLCVNAYRFNGGVWGTRTMYEVTGNGTYSVEVMDVAGNVVQKVISITHIDNENPITELSCDDSTWSRSKTITVSATDAGAGLHIEAYRFHNGAVWSQWSESNTYEATANGTYLIEVKDGVGNVTQKSISLSRIDNKKPTLSATVSDAEVWKTFKTVTLNASDESGITKYEYSYDGSEWFSAGNTWQADKEGWVYYKVTDNVGNVASGAIAVEKIDRTSPTVSLDTSKSCTGIVVVNASDKESGLEVSSYAYSRDGKTWSDWTSSKKFIVKDNGYVYIRVRDKAGNIAGENETLSFYVEIDIEPPTVTVEISEDGRLLIINAKDKYLDEKAYKYDEGEWLCDNTYLLEEIQDELVITVRDIAGNITTVTYVKPGIAASIRQILENETVQKAAAVTTGTTSTVAITFGFVFFFWGFGNVKVYGFDDKGKRIYLCNVSLSKKRWIKIPKHRLKKNKANSIIVKPNSTIVKKYDGELCAIFIGKHRIISRAIQKEIMLKY